MPFNGSGVYSLPTNSFAQPSSGTTISSTDATALWTDFVNSFNQCVVSNETDKPILLNPKIIPTHPSILDTNDNELLEFGTTASAVNHIKLTNNSTGAYPFISTEGADVTGIVFNDKNADTMFDIEPLANSDTFTFITPGLDGSSAPRIDVGPNATGPANIDLAIGTKGTGVLSVEADMEVDNVSARTTDGDLALSGNGTGNVYGTINEHASSPFATTSGTTVAINSLPSWVKRITLVVKQLENDGTAFTMQIGDSGGLLTTSSYEYSNAYIAAAGTTIDYTNNTPSGSWQLISNATNDATSEWTGKVTIDRVTQTEWIFNSNLNEDVAGTPVNISGSGHVTLPTGPIDRILITSGGTMDGGQITAYYEG